MAKKRINKTNEPFDDAFNLFAIIALYPIDRASRIKSYPVSITLVLTLAIFWCFPVFLIGGIVSSMIGLLTILKNLIKTKIYGNKKNK
jgi:predicted ABC-type exoprotein transport system permease subunit